MLKYTCFFAPLLMLMACGSDKSSHETRAYCDTKSFIEAEMQHLTAAKTGLQKELEFNGPKQTISTAKPNWSKELDAFLAIDLHKVNFRGRFDADTILAGDTAYRIIYKANDDKLTLRSCSVTFSKANDQIQSLEAFFDNQNSLYKSSKKLEYVSGNGYRITGTQQVKLGNDLSYEIQGVFIRP